MPWLSLRNFNLSSLSSRSRPTARTSGVIWAQSWTVRATRLPQPAALSFPAHACVALNPYGLVPAEHLDTGSAPLQLGSHEVAPLLWVSEDGREAVFLRPFDLGRYERQQFGFVAFRFVGFSNSTETLVSFCSCPAGRCPDQTGLEPVFSGKDYLLSAPEEVRLPGFVAVCPTCSNVACGAALT